MAPSKNRSCNCGKFHRRAKAAIRIANKSSIQNTRERCQQPADDKYPELDSGNAYASGKTRSGVAADRKDAIPDGGFENNQLKHDEDDECPNYRSINTGEITA